MGTSCCVQQSKESNIALTKLTLTNSLAFPDVQINFTRQKLIRLVADCAIIDINESLNFQNSLLLKDFSNDELRNIQKQIKKLNNNKNLHTTEIVIIENKYQKLLPVQYLAFVCLEMYKGPSTINQILLGYQKLFQQVTKKGLKKFIIGQVQQQLGIPSNKVCECILSGMYIVRQKIQKLSIVMKDKQTQAIYLSIGEKFTSNEVRNSTYSKQYA